MTTTPAHAHEPTPAPADGMELLDALSREEGAAIIIEYRAVLSHAADAPDEAALRDGLADSARAAWRFLRALRGPHAQAVARAAAGHRAGHETLEAALLNAATREAADIAALEPRCRDGYGPDDFREMLRAQAAELEQCRLDKRIGDTAATALQTIGLAVHGLNSLKPV